MKNVTTKFLCVFVLLMLSNVAQKLRAQGSDEQRYQVELHLKDADREVSCKLNSAALSFTRYPAGTALSATADSTSTAEATVANSSAMMGDAVYLNIDAPTFPAETLKLLTKKQAALTGRIVITDTYTKTVAKTIKFEQAFLNSFSDQISAYGYAGRIGNMGVSFTCKTVDIDGTVIEP